MSSTRRGLSRQQRAKLAAHTLHARHAEAAKNNGRKGGEATASRYKDGKKVWAMRMAFKRWYGIDFDYRTDDDGQVRTDGNR